MQVAQNKALNTLDQATVIKPGTRVDSFSVIEAFGDTLELSTLLAGGPLVLMFFCFAGCPACNVALLYYHRNLLPQLKALETQVLALSPQLPQRLIGIKLRLGMDFMVACDRDNRLARRFGLSYIDDEASQRSAHRRGPLGDITGTGTPELPIPTVILLDAQGVVRFVDVSLNSLERTEAASVLAAVRNMTARHATRLRQLATN